MSVPRTWYETTCIVDICPCLLEKFNNSLALKYSGGFALSVHQIMVIKENTHWLTKNAENEPEDHVPHLQLINQVFD